MTNDTYDAERITALLNEARNDTYGLLDIVRSESDLRRPPRDGFRPILWHLGHVAAFEGYWILQRAGGEAPLSSRFDEIFDPIKTPRDDSCNLPPIAEINDYLKHTRDRVVRFAKALDPKSSNPLLRNGYVFDLVLEHEYQHQETLAYLLQMLDPDLKRRPGPESAIGAAGSNSNAVAEMVRVPAGAFDMGSSGQLFAYDNEMPPHRVELEAFSIDKYPVTNAEYAVFIGEGGYQKRSLWSNDGWKWRQEEKIDRPLYWRLEDEASSGSSPANWRLRRMFDLVCLPSSHPVTGVSWHEAEAYARFVGKRLPTEAEWEKAASWDPVSKVARRYAWGDDPPASDKANFGTGLWGETPVGSFARGKSALGGLDMTGNVWEWTASTFTPYRNFEVFPYPEYSEIWFDGDHRVMKGGSWATRAPLLRCAFRNFWRPPFRAAFAGFRCASD
jgi:iron(II)-dependent oxidoreductase